ncbi:MAG: sulfatase-like hydrolase/transferase, partial [Verrucomicrobiota bacterium]
MKTIPNNSASPRLRVRLILLALLLAFGIIPNTHAAESPPNIVIIFIDDMGYGDIGPFGNRVNQTPHLDRMAAEGNVLREFYVSNTACTPSRSALLTGTYAHRIGMDGTVCFPGEDRGLNPDEITIAEILKEKGYTTGCFGKWHLGDQVPFLPLAQGFDQYFGIPYSNDMWPGNARGNPLTNRGPYTPLPVLRQNEVVAHVADGADQSLLAESITDHAVNFIKQNKDKPFFLYLPHAYVHSPRYARPDILKKAQGDINRANVEEVDTSVGRILDTLRDLDLAENTLVLFTSDNGGAGGMSMGPLRGGKGGAKYEGHMREPTIAWWPGKIPAGSETNEIAVTTDLFPSLAKLTGAKVPKDRTIDGKDVLDILLGKPTAKSPHELHYYEVDGIRRGPWKLVRIGNKTELYNLDEDLGERNDLAAKHPAMVKELTDLLDAHAAAIAADTRPAGYVRAGTGKPLISKVGDLPTLRDFVGLPETKAAETHIARAGDLNKKQPPKANRKLPANRQPLKAGGKAKDVLFIAIDDMNDWTTLFDDDNPIQTPNLKRLAARGTFFNRAYCASPGCNPSRTAIMTGLRPTSSGVYGNPEVWAEKLPDVITLPQYFEKHGGYATRGAGKIFHHGKSGADRPHNPSFQEFFQKLAIRGPGPNNNYNGYKKPDHPRLGNVGFDWGEHDQKMIDVDMCEWVEARMEEDFDKPLFLAAGIFNPHLPFYAPKETFDRYPLDETVLPVMKKGDLDDVGEIAKRMVRKEFWVYDNTTSKEPGSPGSLQRMVQSYQAATDYADQMVGRLLDKLDETGRAENTIIVLWSDHGYHLGDKESCVKFTLWEKANRVPFIVVAPGVGKPDQICSRPVSLIDIYPTLLDLAGLPPNAENDGQSLVPLLKNPNREWERPALMTEGPGNHAVRSDRWRYIQYSDGTEELYDHDNDPWEHHNVASDPKHAKVIAQHRRWIPKKEASGKGMDHLYQSPPPAGAGLPNSGYSKTRAARGTKTTEVKTPKTDILIADFEGDTYADWTVEGEAFGSGPAQGTLPRQMPVSGFHGKGLANSFVGGDNATGVLTSPPFKIERPFMNFSIGGGSHTGQTCINLLVGGKIVRNASGPNPRPDASEKMVASTWDLSELAGKTASIQIVDQRTGGWGHITIDHLVLSDKPIAKPIAPVALMELDKTLQVDGTHLLIPVANEGDQINLGIYEDDHLVQSFNVTLPKRKGQHWLAAYPLSKFDLKGKTIRVAPTEGPLLPDTFSHAFDLIQIGTEETVNSDDDYQHPYRDQFHASVRRGWNNDPNGMVYHDGKFHLYYQYNPFGIRWGNMHWGHLQSPDLLHWEEKPIALYQNTTSDMMFSGGGFIDFNNTAGFGENTLFVAFTSTGRGECLAYSTDGGMTFTEMEENPIIEHKGRDPKIIWYEPEQKWILAVYNFESCAETEAIPAKEGTLPKRLHNNIAFWESKNLRE